MLHNEKVPTTRHLSNGVSIPPLGFGTYAIHPCADLVYGALKTGYRLIDTAVMYRNETEVCDGIARWISESPSHSRDEVVYTTKLLDSQQGYENAKRHIQDCLDKASKIGYIDILLIHSPQTNKTDRLGTWAAMQEAVDAGKVKSIGVSNYGIRHLKELLEWDGLKYKPVINQCELSPWLQREDIAGFCAENHIQMEAYSPLTQGEMLDDASLNRVAGRNNKTAAQVLIRWSMQKGFVPIPRSSKLNRVQDNFKAMDFELSDSDMDLIGDPKAYMVFDWDPTRYTG